jgi:LemA protein
MSVASIVVVALIVASVAVAGYSGLVKKRNRTAQAWSRIDVELRRRHDLIPNLVASVKGCVAHESGTFEAVTASRAAAIRAGAGASPAAVACAESALSSSLRSLFAVAESYPALRAQKGFLALQEQLAASEDKIEYARRYYNIVRDDDSATQSFPRAVLAGAFGFRPFEFFETAAADQDTPLVSSSSPTSANGELRRAERVRGDSARQTRPRPPALRRVPMGG